MKEKKSSQPSWRDTLGRALQAAEQSSGQSAVRPYYLFFSLQNAFGAWGISPFALPRHILPEGVGRGDESGVPPGVIDYIEQNALIAAQAREPFRPLDAAGCLNGGVDLVSVANLILRAERNSSSFMYYSYTRPLEEYLALIAATGGQVFRGDDSNPLRKALQIFPDPLPFEIEMTRAGQAGVVLQTRIQPNGRLVQLDRGGARFLTASPAWLMTDRYLFRLAPDIQPELTRVFFESPRIEIPAEAETEFLENYLLLLAGQLPLKGSEVRWEEVRAEPAKRLYLSEDLGRLIAELRFGYVEYEAPYEGSLPLESRQRKPDGSWTLVRIHRKPDLEHEIYTSISSNTTGLKYGSGQIDRDRFILRSNIDPVEFLLRKIPVLARMGFEVYGEEALTNVRVNRHPPVLSINVASGIDWFDVAAVVRFGASEVSLEEIRRALRKKKRFVKLADGTIGELPEEWAQKFKHLFNLGEQTDDGLRLNRQHLVLLENLLEEADQSKADDLFHERLSKLQGLREIPSRPLSKNFRGELRPYQRAGVDWLHFLHGSELGGCLADDMGLGKTIQVLAFLQSLYQANQLKTPSLIVVPRSLLFNWVREAARFTPNLRLFEYFGPGRKKNGGFEDYHLILTTYGTMRRDLQDLRAFEFYYIILDESQAIKNPAAQVSKSTRLLRSRHRLVMTGTPVENSTLELWSQFAFLNPGLLGPFEYFKREFVTPIERNQDEQTASLLRRMVYPFILRRTKEQVAPELPPRTERVVYSDMDPAQQRYYDRTRDYYRGLLLGMIEDKGIDPSRLKVLEGLLRLRQICNHPRLVNDQFRGSSAKMEVLLDHLDTLYAEGHKALIFSQFVQMLKLVQSELDRRKIPYTYLDGQTRKRQERVDAFQNNPKVAFFLISLRAGGVGLNLTAADYVIHIDPWWNPAVELQASDRTHRIGQDKPVFVYKLIARGSVEEKILELQEHKKELVDRLITTESGFFKTLSADDIRVLFSS